jgi:hypothetical protein
MKCLQDENEGKKDTACDLDSEVHRLDHDSEDKRVELQRGCCLVNR